MKLFIDPKVLLYSAIILCTWFAFLGLNVEFFHFENTFLGVFQELFTIPLLGIQFVLLVVSSIRLFSRNVDQKCFIFWAFILLLISNALCLSSLFFG